MTPPCWRKARKIRRKAEKRTAERLFRFEFSQPVLSSYAISCPITGTICEDRKDLISILHRNKKYAMMKKIITEVGI